MSSETGRTYETTPSTRECPKCAGPVAADAAACDVCGQTMPRSKGALVRLAEIASLIAVLAVIVVVCRIVQQVLGV